MCTALFPFKLNTSIACVCPCKYVCERELLSKFYWSLTCRTCGRFKLFDSYPFISFQYTNESQISATPQINVQLKCNYSRPELAENERDLFISNGNSTRFSLSMCTHSPPIERAKKARTHIIVQIYKLVSLELFFVFHFLCHTHSLPISLSHSPSLTVPRSLVLYVPFLCLCVTLFHSLIEKLVVHRFTSFHSKCRSTRCRFFVDSTDSHPGLSNREEKKWFSYYDYLNTLQQQHSHKIFSARNHRPQQINPSETTTTRIRFGKMIQRY